MRSSLGKPAARGLYSANKLDFLIPHGLELGDLTVVIPLAHAHQGLFASVCFELSFGHDLPLRNAGSLVGKAAS
jgi:hypothetical protein